MSFLIRFAIAVLLVCFALDWRSRGDPVDARTTSRGALKSPLERGYSDAMAAARARVDAQMKAAREACASDPLKCLELVRRARVIETR